jgi:N6-adenosine-specific RNA methylase IME4
MKRYAVIVADPPWRFGDSLPGKSRGASNNYDTMATDEICAVKFAHDFGMENSILFLWRVSSMAQDAIRVAHRWNYRPHSEIVWRKLTTNGKEHYGMGRIVRGSHETCMICVRGNPIILSSSRRSIFSAPVGEHSEKPDEFFKIVKSINAGPYAELFARKKRPGWDCFGNQLTPPTVL